MKIVHLSPFFEYRYGGAEVVVRDLVDGLAGEFEQQVLCFGGGYEEQRLRGTRIPIARPFRLHGRLGLAFKRWQIFAPSNFLDAHWASVLERQVEPDVQVLHCHDISFVGSALRIARERKLRLIITLHDIFPRQLFPGQTNPAFEAIIRRLWARREPMYAQAFGFATFITTVSHFCGEKLRGFLGQHGIPLVKHRVIGNWLQPHRETGAFPGGELIFIGRLSREKGIDVLVEAIGNSPLTILSSGGPLAGAIRPRTFVTVPTADVIPIIARHKVLVVPSLFAEPFCLVALEGRRAGVRIIATDAGGIPEVLAGYRLATLIDHRLPRVALRNQLRNAIDSALNAPALEPAKDTLFPVEFSRDFAIARYRELYLQTP